MLTRETVVEAFAELGEALARQRLIGEVAVFGGSSIILQFDVAFVTGDVDVTINREHGAVVAAAAEIARRRGWPGSWLNEGVSVYLGPDPALRHYADFPSPERVGLRVFVATPQYLLALKMRALRTDSRDMEDAVLLARAAGLRGLAALLTLHRTMFAGEEPEPRRMLLLRELAERIDAAA